MTLTDGSTEITFAGIPDQTAETGIVIVGGHHDLVGSRPFGGVAVMHTLGENRQAPPSFTLTTDFDGERAISGLGRLTDRPEAQVPTEEQLRTRASIRTLAQEASGRLASRQVVPDFGVILLDTDAGETTRLFYREPVVSGAIDATLAAIEHEKYEGHLPDRADIQAFVSRMMRRMNPNDPAYIRRANLAQLILPVVVMALLPRKAAVKDALKARSTGSHAPLLA